jgi:hypothetical protein
MPDFKPGIYEDLDYPTYAGITVDGQRAWRSHDLTSLIKCPFTWKNAKAYDESPALLEGGSSTLFFSSIINLLMTSALTLALTGEPRQAKKVTRTGFLAWMVAHLASKIFMIPAWSGVRS